MAIIPETVKGNHYREELEKAGFTLKNQGKVRQMYKIPSRPPQLLMLATDRISIFDFILPALIPQKGEVLTALTYFWVKYILIGYPSHLVGAPGDLRGFLARFPQVPAKRSLVIYKTEIPEFEMVFRRHLGGSVYKDYLKDGKVAGVEVPPGLPKWAYLEQPLFTPASKSQDGHDKNITVQEYCEKMGGDGVTSVSMFTNAYNRAYNYAKSKGILILDTKFEGLFVIADEIITPDSSRFTTVKSFNQAIAQGKDPIFYDKQPVRDWGATIATPFGVTGINKLNPENPEHIKFVHSLRVPDEVVRETHTRYRWIFQKLTGQNLEKFQKYEMKCH